MIVEHSNFL